ncbi:hypothetical protein HDU79_005302 [Rhizoclosmatium sp. JEL0117]|nr:hypothetical protein HDU79_005302 [Rhizoclosmatium sp. JEL0117]
MESLTRLDGSDIPGPQTGQPMTRPISTLVDIPVSRQGSSSSSSSTEDTIIPEQEIVLNPQPYGKRSMINDAFMVSNGEGEKGSFMNAAFRNASLPGLDKKNKEDVTAGESEALRWVPTNPNTALWSVEDTGDWAAMIPRVGVTLKAVIIS